MMLKAIVYLYIIPNQSRNHSENLKVESLVSKELTN